MEESAGAVKHECQPGWIFVFGSNMAGRHGKGAALVARERYGAVPGVGIGRRGDSWAIPTKGNDLQPLPVGHIRSYVKNFIYYAKEHPELNFFLTRVGCGLAGYTDHQIAPLFKDAPLNVHMPPGWRTI